MQCFHINGSHCSLEKKLDNKSKVPVAKKLSLSDALELDIGYQFMVTKCKQAHFFSPHETLQHTRSQKQGFIYLLFVFIRIYLGPLASM